MLTTKNTVNKFLSHRTKRYLCLYVELTNHRRVWYRASPKIEQAVKMTDTEKVYQYLNKHYINVPLRIYWGHNRGIIGVGKIIKYSYMNAPVNLLCTRSQFVDGQRVKRVLSAYHYLRHDYSAYSRLNIFVDLCYWKGRTK